MEELSIEEKAKGYDDALERAKSAIKEYGNNVGRIKMIESIFPELKESEDEKAIRDIKVVLESSATKFFKEEGKMPVWYDRAIAWLEKQGEQKPFDYENANIQQKDFALPLQSERKSLQQVLNDMKNDVDYFVRYAEEYVKEQEQKSAWSEEDK